MPRHHIPHRNRSPHGWWIASYLMRAEWRDEAPVADRSRCLAWENTVLIKARDREVAYRKAIALGRQNTPQFTDSSGKRKGRWVFEGLTSLNSVYEELKDGAEISWTEHKNKTVRRIRAFVKPKRQLAVFDDTPALGDSNN